MSLFRLIVFSGIVLTCSSLSLAQQQAQTGGFNQGNGLTAGLQQSGQISSGIQRDANSFVGASTSNFLSTTATSGATGQAGATGGITGFTGALTSAAFGRGGFGGGFGGRGFGNQFGGGLNNQTAAGASQLRIPVRIGFEARPVSSTVISTKFARRLTNIPALNLTAPVAVKMDGRTAVLQGVVTNEHQRGLIERLANLEPGVSSVRNELTIDPALGQTGVLPANRRAVPLN